MPIMNNTENKKCKILFVHQVSEIGGASCCMLNILKVIDRNFFNPIVLLPKEGPLSKEIHELGIDVYYDCSLCIYPYNKSLSTIGAWREVINVYSSRNKFRKCIIKIHPDIVYLNNIFLFPYLKVINDLGYKSVIHIREHWPENEHRIQFSYIKKNILKYADQIIAINRYSANMVWSKEKMPIVIYDWIDMDNRRGNNSVESIIGESASDLTLFLYTGGMQWIKGAVEVLSAFSSCVKNSGARLLAFGVSPNIKRSGIRGIVKYILYKIGYKTYQYKIKDILESDSRIIPCKSVYNITDIIERCECNISYFTIPHANLTVAECIILNVPSLVAETDESLEYSCNGILAKLYKMNDYEEFKQTLSSIDKWLPILKSRINDNGKQIKKIFDPKRNSDRLNKTLKSVFINHNCS